MNKEFYLYEEIQSIINPNIWRFGYKTRDFCHLLSMFLSN